jgi:hypothetical protein
MMHGQKNMKILWLVGVLYHQNSAELLTDYLFSILYLLFWLCRIYDRLI